MKLIIDIPEELYKTIRKNGYIYEEEAEEIALSIIGGTSLPEHHGRLIDETDLKTLYGLDDRLWWGNAVDKFTDLPTIIEAKVRDKE